jgi:hypothetical protein
VVVIGWGSLALVFVRGIHRRWAGFARWSFVVGSDSCGFVLIGVDSPALVVCRPPPCRLAPPGPSLLGGIRLDSLSLGWICRRWLSLGWSCTGWSCSRWPFGFGWNLPALVVVRVSLGWIRPRRRRCCCSHRRRCCRLRWCGFRRHPRCRSRHHRVGFKVVSVSQGGGMGENGLRQMS